MIRCAPLLALALLCSAAAQAAEGVAAHGADGVARLTAMLEATRSARASFTQVLVDSELRTVKESRGSFALARPGRFRWDYLAPHPQTIVSDGKRLWIYDAELSQVTVKPLDSTLASSPAALLGGSASVTESFDATDLGDDAGLRWIELVPKVKDGEFEKVRLGLGARFVEVLELTDAFSQTTRITFSGMRVNGPVDRKQFEFTPPPGADVIGDPGGKQ